MALEYISILKYGATTRTSGYPPAGSYMTGTGTLLSSPHCPAVIIRRWDVGPLV